MNAQYLPEKSVYRVLAQYIQKGKKCDDYIKGYVDGEDKLNAFLSDYYHYSGTRFTIRSSCKKAKHVSCPSGGATVSHTRYGREDRIYWEFNNRNLVVPFSGVPFITKSSQVKHCQHGSQYYKLKSQKPTESREILQPEVLMTGNAELDLLKKRRRPKPSKKRNCPAYMYIRELVLFPEYALPPENCSKHTNRKEKSNLIYRLRKAMASGGLETLHRFYMHLPLPEAHADHPNGSGVPRLRIMDPMVRCKIDELLSARIYKGRYIQLIVQDYIIENLLKGNNVGYPTSQPAYPTEDEINDYIYLTSVTTSDTSAARPSANDFVERKEIRGEMQKSIQELLSLVQSCSDDETLNKAKKEMIKVIQRVKKCSLVPEPVQNAQQRPRAWQNSRQSISCVPQDANANHQGHAHSIQGQELPFEPVRQHLNPSDIMMHPVGNEDLLSSIMMPAGLGDIHQQDILPTFSRLLESDHGMLTSIDGQMMAHGQEFTPMSGSQIIHDLRPLHPSHYMK